MKILIATGIFKPELGGPATVALELGKRLQATGHSITVLTYSAKSSYRFDAELDFPVIRVVRGKNKILNYFRYFLAAAREMKKHAVTYTLDWFSAGLPILFASKISRKPYVVRVSGGYIWEKYLAEGKPPMTLRAFYENGIYKNYKLMFWLISRVLRNAECVVFNSDEQRVLYERFYKLLPQKTKAIYNAVPDNRISGLVNSYNIDNVERDREIVFAGRFIKMKNVESLVQAFAKFQDHSFKLLLIGEGPLKPDLERLVTKLGLGERVEFMPPMSQSDLYRRIAHSYFVVIPSWTDISPNQAYECLSLGIPFLLTKENYLSINNQQFMKIDPASVADIASKMNQLLGRTEYLKFIGELRRITFDNPWSRVVGEHLKLFSAITRSNHENS